MRFLVICKLYFAIWVGSIQSTYNQYTQLFDLKPEILGYTTPTLYPADAGWSQLYKKRIISDNKSPAFFEKIAASKKSNPLHTALIQNRPKTGKNVDFSKNAGFPNIFRVQHLARTVGRPKQPCLVWCTLIFPYKKISRLVLRDSNLGHHTTKNE